MFTGCTGIYTNQMIFKQTITVNSAPNVCLDTLNTEMPNSLYETSPSAPRSLQGIMEVIFIILDSLIGLVNITTMVFLKARLIWGMGHSAVSSQCVYFIVVLALVSSSQTLSLSDEY